MNAQNGSTYVYVSCAGANEIRILRMDRDSGRLTPVTEVAVPHPSGERPPARKPPNGFTMPLTVARDLKHLYAAMRYPPYTLQTFALDTKTAGLKLQATAPLPASMAYVATDQTGKYLLCASVPSHMLTISRLGADGSLIDPPVQTLLPGPRPHCIITDAANRFLYATVRDADIIGWWPFDEKTGTIPDQPAGTVMLGDGSHPRHIIFHPNNRILYAITEASAAVHAFEVNPETGALREFQRIPIQPADFKEESHCADIHLTPDGRFLYASERFASPITCYRVGPDGRLSLIERFIAEAGPRSFAIESRGRFLISAGQDSEDLSVHAIDQDTGKLTTLAKYQMNINPSWVEIVDLP